MCTNAKPMAARGVTRTHVGAEGSLASRFPLPAHTLVEKEERLLNILLVALVSVYLVS